MVADDPESFADLDGHEGFWTVDKRGTQDSDGCHLAWITCSSSEDVAPNSPLPPAQQQAQDAAKWKKEVERTIQFQKDAREAYRKFGPTAKSVKELEDKVTKYLEKKYGKIETAGTTDSSGNIEMKFDPDPYTREATARHEGVHHQTILSGIALYGKGTDAYNAWYLDPQRWAEDEAKAYSAGIAYLEESLSEMNAPK
jgi:hypothetical protein